MKNLKKILGAFLITVCLGVLLCLQGYAAEKTDPNYSFLAAAGYPESLLDSVSSDYLAKTVAEIGDNEITKVTHRDLISPISYYGSNVDFTVVTAQLKDKGDGHIDSSLVNVYWKWQEKNLPIMRGDDTVTFWWDSDDLFLTEEFYMEDYSRKNVEDSWTVGKTHISYELMRGTISEGSATAITHLSKTDKYLGGAFVTKLIRKDQTVGNENYDGQIYVAYNHITKETARIYIAISVVLVLAVAAVIIVKKKRKEKNLPKLRNP